MGMLKIPRLLTPQQLVIDQLKWHLRDIHLKNKKYSMRALARDLKCSPSFLTMLN
jgi:hypothetical protein